MRMLFQSPPVNRAFTEHHLISTLTMIEVATFNDLEKRIRRGRTLKPSQWDTYRNALRSALDEHLIHASMLVRDAYEEHVPVPVDEFLDKYDQRATYLDTLTRATIGKQAAIVDDYLAQLETDNLDLDTILKRLSYRIGAVHAVTLGITELTRSLAWATRTIGEYAGPSIQPVWYTAEDERVCPICKPLHRTPIDKLPLNLIDGPPAHARCRCWFILAKM